jgi:small-conductance mechanosensitive channel
MKINNLLLLIALFPLFIFSQENKEQIAINTLKKNQVEVSLKSTPVVFNSDTIFYLNSNIKGYPAELRAHDISKRLQTLTESYNPLIDSIINTKKNDYIETRFNDVLLFITTEEEGIFNQVPAINLANNRVEIITEKLLEKEPLPIKEQAKNAGFFILSLLVLIGLIKLINFVFRRINVRLSKVERKFLRKNGYLLKYFIPRKTVNIFVFVSNIIRVTLIILILLFYSPFMFSFFPWAKHVVGMFYNYISSPVKFIFYGFIDFIPSLFFIIVIALFARYIVRVGKEIFMDIDSGKLVFKNFHKDWALPTEKIFSVLIYALALILIFPYIPGSGSSAFQGISIFIGAIISFGSTSAISNIIAGIVITYMRPFQIGDRVKINEIVGDVHAKTILVTHIITTKNEDVTIPNANILLGTITNYSKSEGEHIILHTTITLGYDLPWETANKLLLAAANNTQFLEKTPAPFVLQTSLDDYYVSYELNAYSKFPKKIPLIYSEIHKNILDIFNDAGVEILSPAYMAARDGSLSTVPGQLKPEDKTPLTKIVDHLTGRNQEIIISKPKENI